MHRDACGKDWEVAETLKSCLLIVMPLLKFWSFKGLPEEGSLSRTADISENVLAHDDFCTVLQ